MPRPLADRIIVKPDEPIETRWEMGDKPTTGKVIAIGKKVEELKEGDSVVYGKFSGVEVPIDGEDLLVMREGDILIIL